MTATIHQVKVAGVIGNEVEDLARGIGILVPTSPLSGQPLDLTRRQEVSLVPFIPGLDEKTALVPVIEPTVAVIDTRTRLTKVILWTKRAAAEFVAAAREAVHWLTTGNPPEAPAARVSRRRHVARHSLLTCPGKEYALDTLLRLKVERQQLQREAETEGDLPGRVYRAAYRGVPGDLDDTRTWVERAIIALRELDQTRKAPHRVWREREGYQFRCS